MHNKRIISTDKTIFINKLKGWKYEQKENTITRKLQHRT